MRRLLLLLLACCVPAVATAQISPGPLSKAHEKLEGMTNCTKCHALGSKSMDDACLVCHLEIGWLRDKALGLHGASKGDDCSSCHPEHAGRDFDLIDWGKGGRDGFDHARVGWPLDGAHAKLDCAKCHQPANHRSPVAKLLDEKQKASSFLGLDRGCRGCHAASHDGQLGNQCLDCHTIDAFKPATGFEHTTFALTGAHAKVDCAKCHTQVASDGRTRLYKPQPHAQCSACHADAHQGRFGVECSKCHSDAGWKSVRDGAFDHQKTRFALAGAHVQVACEKCHGAGTRSWPAGKAFGQCADCHATPHGAQLTGRTCETCHTVSGWKPATYGVAEHASSRFALEGAHAKARCDACHGPARPSNLDLTTDVVGRAGWAFALGTQCLDCHHDPHGLEPATSCTGACHGLDAWLPARMGVAEHVGWKLEGAHAATPCFACHPSFTQSIAGASLRSAVAPAAHPLTLDKTACADCHQDPHAGQFAATTCETCHDTNAFEPAVRFDHDTVPAIKLSGGHGKLACAACHPTVDGVVRYRLGTTTCQTCHTSGTFEGKTR